MKSKIIKRAKNKKKKSKIRRVNRRNCHARSRTIKTTRKIIHRGIERERNSIDHRQNETTDDF